MARIKKGAKAKTAGAETAAAPTAKPPKERGRRKDGKGSIVYFMGQLIAAGYLGDELPESAKDQGRAAMKLRQMAEKLARQTRRFGEGDVVPGGEAPADDDADDKEDE
jgi:hypothetical protein